MFSNVLFMRLFYTSFICMYIYLKIIFFLLYLQQKKVKKMESSIK